MLEVPHVNKVLRTKLNLACTKCKTSKQDCSITPPPDVNSGTDDNDNLYKSATSLRVPTSTPAAKPVIRNMARKVRHRFREVFRLLSMCDFCKRLIYFSIVQKCKECKYICHRECKNKVVPSCDLPPKFLEVFKEELAFFGFAPNNTKSNSLAKPGKKPTHASHKQQRSDLPVTDSGANEIMVETHSTPQHDQDSPQQFGDGERTASVSGSADETPTRVDSQDFQISEVDGFRWPRQAQEWDIPFEELEIRELIGTGRFGTVYRGYWHADVAVKVLNADHLEDEKTLGQFKVEVSTFRKTRHENLILFMGACMLPPKLAIVTNFSKGMTLYTHIHLRKDQFDMKAITKVAQQIFQGMGYLHAKGIVHKDLKSKNIFLENGKVMIADFGLFSVTKLYFSNCKNDRLRIPPGWLCYLAPEIMRSLRMNHTHDDELPFSKASDVYAFGTVWYELLCSEWPFKSQPPEAIIWQVGKGMKQPLANLQASREAKDIMMLCWSFRPENRPDFTSLPNLLDKLPKKRLKRIESHPIHLSWSAESTF